ncbi:unnamed protein product [Pseudo-nitzschia multistriata]|uniref:Uncharacterized protein n=1 Tax=Pseudo-nitzschia multistriata TaxID=183589 RepID=A0A448YV77_9STRA|nr:unnamed protein product [Pseudo-nitzschia multistriata]
MKSDKVGNNINSKLKTKKDKNRAKTKRRGKRSNSSNRSTRSQKSTETVPASNVSSCSESLTSETRITNGPSTFSLKVPGDRLLTTSNSILERSENQPVDLDQLVDTMAANNNKGHANSRSNSNHNTQQIALSPAETFDTVPLAHSPSSVSSSSRFSINSGKSNKNNNRDSNRDYLPVSLLNFDSPRNGVGKKPNGNKINGNKVVIEHQLSPSSKSSSSSSPRSSMPLCVWWVKPILGILLIIMLLSGAASVFGWFFKFPSLNDQVEALEDEIEALQGEINRLETQVDRLETENDRYEFLNNQLGIAVFDLEEVKNDLNGTVLDLEQTAWSLNSTKDALANEVIDLSLKNDEYKALNDELKLSVKKITSEASFFRTALDGLKEEHSILTNTTEALRDLVYNFTTTANETNVSLQAMLQETLEGFVTENDRLEALNTNLENGLLYLNTTLNQQGAQTIAQEQSLEAIVALLGDKVEQQQRSTLVQLEISYRQLLMGWDCDFKNVFFGGSSSSSNSNGVVLLPLPDEITAYVDERVLSKLCLDESDFLQYLLYTSSPNSSSISSDQFVRALVLYTEEAMKYYFPSSGIFPGANNNASDRDGLLLSHWIDAAFHCESLQSPFVFYPNGISTRRS